MSYEGMEELGRLIAEGRVKIMKDPDHEGLLLIEVPENTEPIAGLHVREISGKLYYTCETYTAPESYFVYINDVSLPEFVDSKSAEQFIREKAIILQLHDLIIIWKKISHVHESITSLTHTENQEAFKIRWNTNLQQGVSSFDVYARGFNNGIQYPNVRMSGPADFQHMRATKKTPEDPELAAEAPTYSKPPLEENEAYGVFARCIAEILMVAVHAAIIRKASRDIIGPTIRNALAELLIMNDSSWRVR